MGTRYIMDVRSSDDITAKLAQMNSEQATLLTALGLVLDKGSTQFVDDAWRLTRTDASNGFVLCGAAYGTVVSKNENETTITNSHVSAYYSNFIFTENSILIANFNAASPTQGAALVAIITKNGDGKVILISSNAQQTSPYYGSLYIKEKNFGSVGNIPWFYERYNAFCGNFSQYAFTNLPLQMPGTMCNNAFSVLCMQATIFADLVVIDGVEYAVATDGYSSYACR